MRQLEVNDFVETPDGKGVVANLPLSSVDREWTGEVIVKLDDEPNGDRYWRVYRVEVVKKV